MTYCGGPKSAIEAPKTAAKGTFDLWWQVLLRWLFLPPLQCCYRSIAAVTKSAAIDTTFSAGFGLFCLLPYDVQIHVN